MMMVCGSSVVRNDVLSIAGAASQYIHRPTYIQIYIAPKIVRTNLKRWHRMTRR